MSEQLAKCKSCGASIIWVRMLASGKANPLDAEPTPNGNVVILRREGREVIAAPQRGSELLVGATAARYVSHFATCPQSKQHRRPA